jgi:hypothetical protein
MSRVRLLPPLLVAVLVLAGCSDGGSDDPGPEPSAGATSGPSGREAAERRPAVSLVPFRSGPGREYGRGTTLAGCGSIGAAPIAYETPVLVQVRLRVAERVRLLPATYAERSNAIDSVTQYLGPDPGPAAPHMAVSQGVGPTSDRLSYDTRPIGDARNSPAGLAGAQRSWQQRVPLDRPRRVEPGDHYLFVQVDPAKGGMNLHELTMRWQGGERRIGRLSLRVLCGG